MEPTDLNASSHPGDEAEFESWLRRETPALPDDGFSTRVLAALPSKGSARWPVRVLLLAFAALGGLGLAIARIVATGGVDAIAAAFDARLIQVQSTSVQIISAPLGSGFLFALIVTICSLLYVFRPSLSPRGIGSR